MKRKLPPLTSKEDALALLFSRWTPVRRTETIPLAEADGRVLGEDRYADWDLPVVRASLMDGIAVRSSLFADGLPDTSAWQPGRDYVRADTGDDFPDEFDAVIAIEDVTVGENGGIRLAEGLAVKAGDNIKGRGADVRRGDLLLSSGTVLTPRDLAVLGAAGSAEIPVIVRPRVAFLPTGSELIPVGTPLRRGQNYDTNSLMAAPMLRRMGAEPVMHEIVPDEPEEIRRAFLELLPQSDIVLVNAGTSKGAEDYCAKLLEEQGDVLFHGVAAVPGRPMSMAVVNGRAVINLSGPTPAAFHSIYWAVRPIICYALGLPAPEPRTVRAVLTGPIRTQAELSKMCPVRLERKDGIVLGHPVDLHGPRTASLTAEGIYLTKPGEAPLSAGDEITVELPD